MTITFTASHNSQSENSTIYILTKALSDKPLLTNYIFSDRVVIDEQIQPPHSHPVITLNTRDNDKPELVLSNFVHEQLHHFLHAHDPELEQVVDMLKQRYKNVPIGFPEGANNEFWTYAHLILCALEQMILREVFGTNFATFSLHYWQTHHYRWIYQTVESDYEAILSLAKAHNLIPTK